MVGVTLADDVGGDQLGLNVEGDVSPNVTNEVLIVGARDILLLLADEPPNLINLNGTERKVLPLLIEKGLA